MGETMRTTLKHLNMREQQKESDKKKVTDQNKVLT